MALFKLHQFKQESICLQMVELSLSHSKRSCENLLKNRKVSVQGSSALTCLQVRWDIGNRAKKGSKGSWKELTSFRYLEVQHLTPSSSNGRSTSASKCDDGTNPALHRWESAAVGFTPHPKQASECKRKKASSPCASNLSDASLMSTRQAQPREPWFWQVKSFSLHL